MIELLIIYLIGSVISFSLWMGTYYFFVAPERRKKTLMKAITYVSLLLSWITLAVLVLGSLLLSLFFFGMFIIATTASKIDFIVNSRTLTKLNHPINPDNQEDGYY